MKLSIPLVLGGVLLATPVGVGGHHSMPNFWHMDRVLEVTNQDGTKSTWRITGAGNASAMIRSGWTNRTLEQGMKVKVAGRPSQNTAAKALLAGVVTKPDGTKVEFSGGGAGNFDAAGGR